MTTRTFTLSEANAMLPQLQEDLRSLQTLAAQIEEHYKELERKKIAFRQLSIPPADNDQDPFFEEESKLEFMRIEADVLIGNFKRSGVLLKSIDPGLIDFPSVIDGENVLICWLQGEERISHYHGWNDGFRGRKPLPGV